MWKTLYGNVIGKLTSAKVIRVFVTSSGVVRAADIPPILYFFNMDNLRLSSYTFLEICIICLPATAPQIADSYGAHSFLLLYFVIINLKCSQSGNCIDPNGISLSKVVKYDRYRPFSPFETLKWLIS